MFEPLTKIIAYIFTFMIAAVVICFALVLYIDKIPQESNYLQQNIDIVIDTRPVLNELQSQGKSIFNSNCASCHKVNKKMTGPALAGVTDKYEKEWLYAWIKNSQKLIASGDAAAISIYNEYNQAAMNSFEQLSYQDIDAILAYIDAYKK